MPSATISCLQLLRYSSPIVTTSCAILLSTISTCFVRPSRRTVLRPSQRVISRYFSLITALLYAVDGLLYAFRMLFEAGWVAEEDIVVYITLCFLIWLIIHIIQTDVEEVVRLPNVGTWALAGVFDAIICLLTLRALPRHPIEYSHLSIQIMRVAALTLLCSLTVLPGEETAENRPEGELLSRSIYTTTIEHSAEYGDLLEDDGVTRDEIKHSNDRNSRRKHPQRIERLGGLWSYLQELKFLIPLVIPIEDLKLQLYAIAMLVLMLCDRASSLLGPALVGNIAEHISKNNGKVPWWPILVLGIVKLPHDVIIAPARRWLSIRMYFWSNRQLHLAFFSHILGLSLAFHDNKQTGEVKAAIDQGDKVSTFVDDSIENTIPLGLDTLVAFVYLTCLFDTYLGLVLATIYVVYCIITYKGTAWVAKVRRKYQTTQRIESNIVYETIANWTSAFYLNRQAYQQHRLNTITTQELEEATLSYDLSQVTHILQSLVICLGYLAALLRAASLTMGNDGAVRDFVTLLLFWPIFTKPLFRFALSYDHLVLQLTDAERILEIAQEKPTVVDIAGAPDLIFKGGKIEYRNVSFSYDGKATIIKDLNFVVSPGSTIAFVGQTGSGKTTTCDKLLFRGYDVTEGAILVDDQDIREVTQWSLRELIGIVRQEQAFYNDTILEVVRFARLDAMDEEVIEACKNAAVHDQIMAFPADYNSRIGERGVKLSGGQRQRIAIAQLFLRNPKIVVLDEATSTVDNTTESEIQDAFARICNGRTTLIVAHRLSTIQHADQIFFLDRGTIVERGTHEELLAKRGKYYRLWYKKRTADQLESALDRCKSTTNYLDAQAPLMYWSDDGQSDDGSMADISQFDGATSSKQADDTYRPRTGVRKRVQDLTRKFGVRQKHDEENDDCEVDDADEDTSPMRAISPRATDAASLNTFPSRSFFPRKLLRSVSMSTPSSPVSPTRAPAPETPALCPTSIQRTIPISVTPFSSPVKPKPDPPLVSLFPSPQPPSRETALNSHAVTKKAGILSGPSTRETSATSCRSSSNSNIV